MVVHTGVLEVAGVGGRTGTDPGRFSRARLICVRHYIAQKGGEGGT